MSLLCNDNRRRFVSLSIIIVYISVGFTTWKHLLPSSDPRWTSQGREARCIDYRAERLNLTSAVDGGIAPANDLAGQLFSSILPNVFISSHALQPNCQRTAVFENFSLTRSTILNL